MCVKKKTKTAPPQNFELAGLATRVKQKNAPPPAAAWNKKTGDPEILRNLPSTEIPQSIMLVLRRLFFTLFTHALEERGVFRLRHKFGGFGIVFSRSQQFRQRVHAFADWPVFHKTLNDF